jgi:hypothetical protein
VKQKVGVRSQESYRSVDYGRNQVPIGKVAVQACVTGAACKNSMREETDVEMLGVHWRRAHGGALKSLVTAIVVEGGERRNN